MVISFILDKDLHEFSDGVKTTPQTMEEIIPTLFDCLHLLLSMARWIINLLRRLNHRLTSWSITAEFQEKDVEVFEKLKMDILYHFGINLGKQSIKYIQSSSTIKKIVLMAVQL